MTLYVFKISIIIIICIIASKLSYKIGVPSLLLFLILGMIFGSDGLIKIQFDNYKDTENICTIALVFIMFYGGFGTNWKVARPVAIQSFMLSTFGVVITALLTAVFAHFVLRFEVLESLLIGAVISSTDAASVFSILRSKNLNLKNGLASLLEIESGSNDPIAYMLVIVTLSLMSKTANQVSVLYMLFSQIVYGASIGFVISYVSIYALKKFASGLDTVFVLAVAILSYSLSTIIGGNGYLTVYIVGIILGNSSIKNKVALVHFFDGITSLMHIVAFFLLGLLAFPSEIPKIALPSVFIVLFLSIVARPIAVFMVLFPFKKPIKEQLFISLSGIRGVASIVFAILAITSANYTKIDIFHIVFFLVLISVSVQGSLLPVIAKRLKLVDKNSDVLKTFTDYEDEDYGLIEVYVSKTHGWRNKKVKDIEFPLDSIAIMIIRRDENIVPSGETVLKINDTVILNCKKYKEYDNIDLTEVKIDSSHPFVNKLIKDLDNKESGLIVMLKRESGNIIPKGDTLIKKGDILILNKK